MEANVKLSTLSNKEISGLLKQMDCIWVDFPTNDICRCVNSDFRLNNFISECGDEYWFQDAIGVKVVNKTLHFIYDNKTQERINADLQAFYKDKAVFVGKYGSN